MRQMDLYCPHAYVTGMELDTLLTHSESGSELARLLCQFMAEDIGVEQTSVETPRSSCTPTVSSSPSSKTARCGWAMPQVPCHTHRVSLD
jgi:hypothetical protein